MKRYLPFILVALVAIRTVGIATILYRAKTQPAAAALVRTGTPAPTAKAPVAAKEKENETLHGHGPTNAPVTIEIYADFQCPACATASRAISDLERQRAGQLRVIFHQFPLAMHKHAVEAAMAAEAASLQGHFWEMHDKLYQYQSVWSKADEVGRFFAAYAESLGLDVAQFEQDRKSPEVRARVISDGNSGAARGVKNTPTIFINGEVRSAFTREKLDEAIKAALAESKKS